MLLLWGDQGLNAKVFAEKEVGIGVPRDEKDGSFTRKSIAESLKLVIYKKIDYVHVFHVFHVYIIADVFFLNSYLRTTCLC